MDSNYDESKHLIHVFCAIVSTAIVIECNAVSYDFIGCKIHQTACRRKNITRWNYFVLQI